MVEIVRVVSKRFSSIVNPEEFRMQKVVGKQGSSLLKGFCNTI